MAIEKMKVKAIKLMKQANPDMAMKHITPIVDLLVDNFVKWRKDLNVWGDRSSLTIESHFKYIALRELVVAYGVDVNDLHKEAQAIMDIIEEE